MATQTKPTTFFGLFNDGYQSNDGNGHTGYGSTPEASQTALERSQEVDSNWSEHTEVGSPEMGV